MLLLWFAVSAPPPGPWTPVIPTVASWSINFPSPA